MNPTLVEPLLLEINCGVPQEALCSGDVILFRLPQQERATVHRILRITSQGMITRGDNNTFEDPLIVPACHIIGKVIAAQRGSRRFTIYGGRRGLVRHYFLRLQRTAWRFIQLRLHAFYRRLARSGIIAGLLPDSFTPRVIAFRSRGATKHQLILRKQVIGEYDSQLNTWRIRPPYRLLLDENKLPTPGDEPNQQVRW